MEQSGQIEPRAAANGRSARGPWVRGPRISEQDLPAFHVELVEPDAIRGPRSPSGRIGGVRPHDSMILTELAVSGLRCFEQAALENSTGCGPGCGTRVG